MLQSKKCGIKDGGVRSERDRTNLQIQTISMLGHSNNRLRGPYGFLPNTWWGTGTNPESSMQRKKKRNVEVAKSCDALNIVVSPREILEKKSHCIWAISR